MSVCMRIGLRLTLVAACILFVAQPALHAQQADPVPATPDTGLSLQLDLGQQLQDGDFALGIQIVILMTLLTLAPTLVLLTTSFLRIVIVLGFVRQALGTQQTPSNQVLIGLALFMSLFIMSPVWTKVYEQAYTPYTEGEITSEVALSVATQNMQQFMLQQTRPSDLEFFLSLAQTEVATPEDLPMTITMPAFILSELRTAFQMGVMIYIPFLMIDFVVASTLMSLGMLMMPPVMISLPFKLLLFVLVDGWYLILSSLVQSFSF